MRILRKILVVGALSLLLVLALGIGGAGAALFFTFGSGKSVVAQGPQISTVSADPCSVILIDLEQVYVNLPEQLTLLPNPREIIRISTVPETDLVAGLLDRESVDTVILGFDTCVISQDSEGSLPWTLTHSALGQPWFDVSSGAATGAFIEQIQGQEVDFSTSQVSHSTLIVGALSESTSIEEIIIDAQVSYPDANTWTLGLAIMAGLLIILFIGLVVLVVVRGTRKSPA
ncbi:MAG: hypothetical protein K0U56_08725 [Actinomycetia bacterium]|nr:hypothetical protein [Actinomycetes bacterium]